MASTAPHLCTCTFWRCVGMLEAAHRAIACLLATAGPCWGVPPAQVPITVNSNSLADDLTSYCWALHRTLHHSLPGSYALNGTARHVT